MMVPKKSLFLVGAALLFAGAVPGAQQNGDKGPLFRRATKPLRTVSIDLETGTITRGPVVQNKAFTTCSSFNSNDFSGFVGVDSGPGGANGPCEWIDAGVKTSGKSGYMTGFTFAYCSAALSTLSGGVGGAATVGFRVGYSKGSAANAAGPTGTEVFRVCLTGLPANTNCSSFFGGFSCFLVGFTFGNIPVCYPDGKIGWSWQFKDLGTDGVLAKTFPFLSCVQSCTGNGPDGFGMVDCIDQYCPAGTLLSTFQFGTTPFGGYFTSISMDIREASVTPHPSGTDNGSGVNTRTLTTVTDPEVNKTFLVLIDCTGADAAKASITRLSFAGLLPAPILTVWGEVLVFITAGTGKNFIIPHAGGIVPFGAPLPKDLGFVCFPFALQSFCGDTPFGQLTNATTHTVGIGIN